MSLFSAKSLSKAFGPSVILEGAELAIQSQERVGLVGANGSGKSTLARIIAGRVEADAGELARRRGARISYLDQEPQLDPEHDARTAVAEGLSAWVAARDAHAAISARIDAGGGEVAVLLSEQAEAAAEVERLGGWARESEVQRILQQVGGVPATQKVGSMSGGERRRVALARLLVAQPDLAILDEPTNHLDTSTIEWLEAYLCESFPGALLLITHDRYLLNRVVQRTLELDGGRIFSYAGGWESYLEAKAERLAHAARAEANRQNFLRTEIEWLRRGPKARSTKQKARIKRAHEALGARTEGPEQEVSLALETTRLGHTVLDLKGLSLQIAGRCLIQGFDLSLTRGERVGVLGPNGTGKTSFLRTLLGELEPSAGSIVVGKNTRLAYFDQHRNTLDLDATVHENVSGKRTALEVGGRTMDVRAYLERFLFAPERIRQKVGSLSGGEKARVALARMLLSPANLLLLDEPTNDLDVTTLSALEQMLVEMDATAIIVSHDRYFLDRVATSILAFEGAGRVVRYVGDYSTYKGLVEQKRARPEAGSVKARPRERPKPEAKSRGLSYREREELSRLPEQIESAESRLRALEGQLADPTLYATRGAEVPEINAQREAAVAEVAALMERWELLESRSP